jgi:hypothetical protein
MVDIVACYHPAPLKFITRSSQFAARRQGLEQLHRLCRKALGFGVLAQVPVDGRQVAQIVSDLLWLV